jgi:hypothetical protein
MLTGISDAQPLEVGAALACPKYYLKIEFFELKTQNHLTEARRHPNPNFTFEQSDITLLQPRRSKREFGKTETVEPLRKLKRRNFQRKNRHGDSYDLTLGLWKRLIMPWPTRSNVR